MAKVKHYTEIERHETTKSPGLTQMLRKSEQFMYQ